MSKVHHLTAQDLIVGAAAKPARRPRKWTLAAVANQARKAGLEVARYEVTGDKIVVVTGGALAREPSDLDDELAAFEARHGKG